MLRFAFLLAAVALAHEAAAQANAVVPLSEAPVDPGVGVQPDRSEPEPEPERSGPPALYAIRPGDVLSISVLEDPNLNRTVLVRPDGRISLPIAGSVYVEGIAPENLEPRLAERFSRGFQITPTVTVSVQGLAPQQRSAAQGEEAVEPTIFYMLGSVGQVGALQTLEEITLIEALAIAGGPTAFAAKDRIQLRRTDADGNQTVTIFDYEKFEEGLPLVGNEVIQDGDIVFVPERGLWD